MIDVWASYETMPNYSFCATITTNEELLYVTHCPGTLGCFNSNIEKLQIINYTLGFEDC